MIRSLTQVHSVVSLLIAECFKKKISSFKTYHSNGNLKVLGAHEVRTGSKTGIWNIYGKNGNLLKVVEYSNDELNGESITYYGSGKLKKIESYKNGKLDGETKLFLNNGNLFQTKYYKNGVPVQKS
tara:strand:- start:44 stop:421 length:378 start_codon:yes stop_codon:yes gene_type:complete